MAKQKGIVQLQGTIGEITFARTQDGFLAKQKTSLDGKRILSDEGFQRTRENMNEFSNGTKAAKLFRKAFHIQLKPFQDNRIVSRLVKQMMRIIQSDANDRGERNVITGRIWRRLRSIYLLIRP